MSKPTGRWFRMYADVLHDPKVQKLPASLFKIWVNILCMVAKSDGGCLPSVKELAFTLRVRGDRMQAAIESLSEAGLLVAKDGTVCVHNWDKWQYKDLSTQRVRRFRNADETPQIQNTDTESDTESKPETEDTLIVSCTGKKEYIFEEGVIRLTRDDYQKWKTRFSNINLDAELTGLAQWAGKQENWFFALSGALAKRDRAALLAIKSEAKKPNGLDNPWIRPATPFD